MTEISEQAHDNARARRRRAVTANRELASRAAQMAAKAMRGSLDRKAYGCASVALQPTATLAAARKLLTACDLPGDIVAAALEALDQLATSSEPVRRSA